MEAKRITWEELSERAGGMVGKDIETEAEVTVRGPIRSFLIDFNKDVATFILDWLARFDSRTASKDDWVLLIPPGEAAVKFVQISSCRVEDIGEGRIRLVEQSGASSVVFTAHENLKPADVKNFPH